MIQLTNSALPGVYQRRLGRRINFELTLEIDLQWSELKIGTDDYLLLISI